MTVRPEGLAGYLLAISVVAGLGSFALAADCYQRLLARRGGRVLDAYVAVLAVALVPGTVVLGPDAVLGTPTAAVAAAAVPAGFAAGVLARRLDRSIVRRAARRTGRRPRAGPPAGPPAGGDGGPRASRVTPTAGALLLGGGGRREPGGHRGADLRRQVDPRQFPLPVVVAVAVVEELFYRGVLLRAATLPAGVPAALLVAATVLAFALAHLTFGWAHVLAKAPLGGFAAAAVLVSGTVLPAVLAHVWFNVSAWRELRPGGGQR